MSLVELVDPEHQKDYFVGAVAVGRNLSLVELVAPKCQTDLFAGVVAVAADLKCRILTPVEVVAAVDPDWQKDYLIEAVAAAGSECRMSKLAFAVVDPNHQKDYLAEAAVVVQRYSVVAERTCYLYPRFQREYSDLLAKKGWV